jgi:hypothetical protein
MLPLKKPKLEFLINQLFSKLKKNSLSMLDLPSAKVIPRVLHSQIPLIRENVETTTQSKELKT